MLPSESMSNTVSDVASREYTIVSPASASVAVIVATTVPSELFSGTDAVLTWPVNTGAWLAFATVRAAAVVRLSEVPPPSVHDTVTAIVWPTSACTSV